MAALQQPKAIKGESNHSRGFSLSLAADQEGLFNMASSLMPDLPVLVAELDPSSTQVHSPTATLALGGAEDLAHTRGKRRSNSRGDPSPGKKGKGKPRCSSMKTLF